MTSIKLKCLEMNAEKEKRKKQNNLANKLGAKQAELSKICSRNKIISFQLI